LFFELPPPIAEQVNVNTVLIAFIAALVTLATPAITVWGTIKVRSAEREEDRRDRALVADAVKKVATDVKEANVERVEQLRDIRATGEATHAIVNNQRTVMLRQIAVLARIVARDHPEDALLQKAARDAERDLEENMKMNEDPDTKPKLQKAEEAVRNGMNSEPA
jgi:hypothetical protein